MNRVWALIAASGLAQAVSGQVIWNNAAGGAWSNAANWNPMVVPNSSSTDVEFPFAATTDSNFTPQIRNLSILNASARVQIINNSGLNVYGSVSNSGTLVINPAAGPNNTYVQFSGGTTLLGTGTLLLNANAGNLDTGYISGLTAGSLTNSAQHTITGIGREYMPLVNEGLVLADGTGNVLDFPSTVTNNNLIKARNAGVTLLRGAVTQGSGGILRAESGGAIALYSTSYTGGTMEAAGGTVEPTPGAVPTLNIVSYTGNMAIANNTGVVVSSNGYTHNGTVTINPSAGPNNSYLSFSGGGLLRGSSCTIAMNANPNNLDTAYVTGNGALTLDASARIVGRGRIYGNWTNNGLIESAGSGNFIDFTSGSQTNNSIIRAGTGAYLMLRNAISQAPQGTLQAAGGDLYFYSVNYIGGHIEASSGGHLYPVAGSVPRFDVVSIDGDIPIPNNTGVRFGGAGAMVNGTITVNTTAGPNNCYVVFDNAGPLNGNANIVLNANASNLDTGYVSSPSLTLPAGNSITGRGRLYGSIQNNGFIGVSGAGNVIDIPAAINNSSLMRSENGGAFTLRTALSQTGPGMIVTDASPLYLYSYVYSGGTFNAINGGSIEIVQGAASTLSNVTVSGPINVPNNSGLRIANTGWHFDGTVTVNTSGGPNNAYLIFNSAGTYSGNNTIVLNANPANLDTGYLQSAGGSVTIPASSTVRGNGRFYGNWTNQGQILTTGAGNTMDFTGGAIDNQSVIRASNGAILTLRESFTQSASARIEGLDSIIYLYGTTYAGGQMVTTGAGEVYVTGGTTLNGVQIDSLVRIPNNTSCTIAGGSLIHNGDLLLNPTAGPNNSSITFAGPTTISGSGTWRLTANAGNFDTAYLTTTGGTTQFNKRLAGHGRIYCPIVFNNTISPDSDGSPIGTFEFRAPLTLGNNARFEVQIGSGLQCDRLASNNPVSVGGDLVVTFAPGYVPAFDDQFTIITGSSTTGGFVHETLPGLPNPHWKWVTLVNSNNVKVIIGCGSDYNSDGNVDLFDYLDFVNVFSQGGPDADFNLDGVVDFFDYLDFVDSFARPC